MDESRMKRAAGSTASAMQKEMGGQGGERPTSGTVDKASVAATIEAWPDIPQKVARTMLDKYGPPNEATPSRLIWYNNGPWKRTIVYRDEVPHNFPKPHVDVLEQFIDYRVPVEKFDELAAFDGSVIPERTKGEISARCDMEEMNFLALNLAHDIVTGKRTVDEARESYAETANAFMMKRSAPYTEKLQFQAPQGDTADLDQTMMAGPMMHQAAEKVQDKFGGQSG